MDDDYHLLVMDLIVLLDHAQPFGEKCDQVPLSILWRLLGDGHFGCYI